MSISSQYYLMYSDVNSNYPDMSGYDTLRFYEETPEDSVREIGINFDNYRKKDFFFADVHFNFENISTISAALAEKLLKLNLPATNIFKGTYGKIIEKYGKSYYLMKCRHSLSVFSFADQARGGDCQVMQFDENKEPVLINNKFTDLPLQQRLMFTDEGKDNDSLIFVHQTIVDVFVENGFSGAIFIPLSAWNGEYKRCYEMVRSRDPAIIRPVAEFIPPVKEKLDLQFDKMYVDIKSPSSVTKLLNSLNKLAQYFYEYLVDFNKVAIGSEVDGEFVSLKKQLPTDKIFESTSDESIFFEVACTNLNNRKLVVDYVEQCFSMTEDTGAVAVNYETPFGLVAACSLAESDKQYVSLFLRYLTLLNMDHEVHEGSFIGAVYHKWGACDEVLPLIAARLTYLAGQTGNDSLPYFSIPEDKHKAFFDLFLEGIEASVCSPDVEEVFQAFGIPVDMSIYNRSQEPKYEEVVKK